ncbi:MAG TPA: bifunctional UDP-N-acetylglucosamine diphosphorylase/glucosamine-1-phosphate N-acetyltransferase GlmU [Aliidongia sp.]|uniref:bifunctional UDP-N-acetylglucosamine diphosphorylase/glucosamine-1-phosphate N-acetyltransferase GlmU n=1 Tax=Aliidongia sp. TaxID=1914230 RepID=UPI002DDD4CE0|nr:bifunctional UDP-N-acetylglucosamine diphosphorylase/glucosamine-1-phosphate N-acetyltransferase GlmU [Aliidongia sp.]HEV2678407.1 bifunctional UDP-N-acetylglucosamine diphosphorylase/glucosamine-1-phosphate N-acetyltransferase GlmU [Aliidongia sp.]
MSRNRLAIVILAAGKGTRMKSALPKVMHEIAGKPMLRHVIDTCGRLDPDRMVVVAGPDMPGVEKAAAPHALAHQMEQRGTGHAVGCAQDALGGRRFDAVLVVYGDTPLITAETLSRMVAERQRTDAAVVVLGMRVAPPNAYGRLVLDAGGDLDAIVEAAEASPEILALDLCNSGVMVIDGAVLFDLVGRVEDGNSKGEFYLTDIVGIARGDGRRARVVEAPVDELVGVNSRADLAAAEAILQQRLRAAAMADGATLVDPASVFLAADTVFGRDVVIGPHVVFGPGVTVGDRVQIKSFSHIEGARIGAGAVIGPFARLRPGTELAEDVHIGNFVELKNAQLGRGAKANHLTYLGDATVGSGTNIGAGTITVNYDGFGKYRTEIGARAFIGSHSSLVAPITIGDGAMTAAGSVVTQNVEADAIAIGRARQIDKPGRAAAFRAAQSVKHKK